MPPRLTAIVTCPLCQWTVQITDDTAYDIAVFLHRQLSAHIAALHPLSGINAAQPFKVIKGITP